MEKIKIKKEHEEMLEVVMDNYSLNGAIEAFIGEKGTPKKLKDYFPLNKFTLLLCGWYEVEESYSVGDWAIHNNGAICEITHFDSCGFARGNWTNQGDNTGSLECPVASFKRKATPEEIAQEKERRKWAEIGREVGEYKDGDIAFNKVTEEFGTIDDEGFDGIFFVNAGRGEEAHPADLVLVTPVEQRLDKEAKS